jgi:hypothetical protein
MLSVRQQPSILEVDQFAIQFGLDQGPRSIKARQGDNKRSTSVRMDRPTLTFHHAAACHEGSLEQRD